MRYERQARMKDGGVCVLRSPGPQDAAAILRHMEITSGETEYLLRYPDEISRSEAQEAEFLAGLEASQNALMICAVVEGEVVASAGFTPVSLLEKCRHRAELGLSIRQEYWGRGLGSLLVEALLAEAKKAGYERMELDVVSGNGRALALYKKFGFTVYGRNVRGFRRREGGYQALVLMGRAL